jgi:hypothetical protein
VLARDPANAGCDDATLQAKLTEAVDSCGGDRAKLKAGIPALIKRVRHRTKLAA